jgi:hypothetical protein
VLKQPAMQIIIGGQKKGIVVDDEDDWDLMPSASKADLPTGKVIQQPSSTFEIKQDLKLV